jgi:cystathionine gamma-lyase
MSEHRHESENYNFQTNAIHAGQEPENTVSRCVVPPIIMSTTFKQYAPGETAGFDYGRSGNPTRRALETCLASLEKAKYAMVFSSGLASLTTLTYLLKTGDHILVVDDVYGGSNRFFQSCASRMGIDQTFVDMLDLKKTEEAFRPNTVMVWVETPTNPTLKLIDIEAVVKLARKNNPNTIVVVDNTFASSYFQNPLELGADIVMHSLTKYMNGHSDAIMGAIMLNDEELNKKMLFLQNSCGAVPSPFDCYMVNRGLKTLALRMREHQKNGMEVAGYLDTNPRIEKVIYPGLKSHPQHDLFKKQMKGFGGMVSFYIKGDLKAATTFMQSLKIITLAESLGGYESLVEHPALMTHASVPAEQRAVLGINDNFIRMSIGLEDAQDLIKDINDALIKAIPTI